uniref:MFS domain-containing protein n=1 Tax=Parastrongyloides trichosuri TaxID=131310 RepID=A0A0N4ZKY0_PARTI
MEETKPEPIVEHTTFKTFQLKEWIILSTLVIGNIVSLMEFSCITPFFVDVALKKGVPLTVQGLVFAVFDFWGFILSPCVGRILPILGVRVIYTTGIVLLSIGTFIFAATDLIKSGTGFFISTLILRIVQSTGNVMMFTTTYTIASKDFPKIMSTMLGFTETGAGIGLTIGPVVGGFLYQFVGYPYPFLILGSISSVTAVVAFFYVSSRSGDKIIESSQEDQKEEKKHLTWKELVKIKDIWCMAFTLILVGMVVSFHDSTLAAGSKQFNLTSGQIGLLFLCLALSYATFAPILGLIVDRYSFLNDYVFIVGYILEIGVFTCMGPVPFFNYKSTPKLYGICLAVMGMASSMLFVPSFKRSMDIVLKDHGFAESLKTSSVVSGMYIAAFRLGSFIGPFVGSTLVEHKGYRNALSIVAAICLCSAIFFSIVYLIPRFIKKYHKKDQSVESES